VNDWLILRFGALGDLCLLGWSLAALADAPDRGDRRVTLATKAGFAPLCARFHGVDAVVPLEGRSLGALGALAGRLRARRWHHVVDAHHVLRSHALLTLAGRRADARLAKDTGARLFLLAGGETGTGRLGLTMVDRFDEALGLRGDGAPAPPPVRRPPLAALAAEVAAAAAPGPAPLGLAPGARWATKRWPEAHWVALVERLAAAGERDLRVFLGPEEQAWFPGGRLEAAARAAGATVVEGRPLLEVARELAACRALATNDSGLLHLGEAVGTPVVAFFGPTVRAFGYFPRLPRSRVLEHDLDCRPCSRNGKRPCHRGDLACLVAVAPEAAAAALLAAGAPA
jgi:heptosyltransferase II